MRATVYTNTRNEGLLARLKRKASNMFAAVAAHMIHFGSGNFSNRLAGKALIGQKGRKITPQEWLLRWMIDNWYPVRHKGAPSPFLRGFALPEPRSSNPGYARRRNDPQFPKVNYRKQNNRIARALRTFNGEPARGWSEQLGGKNKRDALTGIVS